MPASLDTNVLLRLALRDIPSQYAIAQGLITTSGARYRVADIAIDEMVHALTYHYAMTRPQVAAIVRAIIWDVAIDTSSTFLDAVLTLFEANKHLSFTDCYLAEDARASGNAPLLTFDKKLAASHPAAELP